MAHYIDDEVHDTRNKETGSVLECTTCTGDNKGEKHVLDNPRVTGDIGFRGLRLETPPDYGEYTRGGPFGLFEEDGDCPTETRNNAPT